MARPRITTLEICDFGAFPGPGTFEIRLNGKNLLIYGENGSGKSTIFHAFQKMFPVNWKPEDLAAELDWRANRFTHADHKGHSRVAIKYDDDQPAAIWSAIGHPANAVPGPADARIVNAAWANAILDYRALLETNHDNGDEEVNLFEVCVNYLLRDYVAAGGDRLGEIWQRLQDRLLAPQLRKAQLDEINLDSRAFNDALDEALKAIFPLIAPLLAKLGHPEIGISAITPSRIAYNNSGLREGRDFNDCEVKIDLTFHGLAIDYPHLFLNEARLSALALAIYFAGRQLAENQTKKDMPRIMVLDDVLIGLDQSNRLPVLELLKSDDFKEWQIVLLTFDRVWFEMARASLPDDGVTAWTALELFEGAGSELNSVPVLRPLDNFDPIAGNLARAEAFLAQHHDNAAAVHTRIAFEQSLKRFCNRGIPVVFKTNQKELNTEHLLAGIDDWLSKPKYVAQKAVLDPLIAAARASRSVVLNAYSHSTAVTLCRAEIQSAVDAVRALDVGLKAQFPKNATI